MLDLRKLLLMIQEQKQMTANMSLEFDCMVDTEDPKPLIKVINYIINYLTPLATNTLEIQLNTYRESYMISFSIFTATTEFPAFSDQLEEALAPFNGRIEKTFEPGSYIRIIMHLS